MSIFGCYYWILCTRRWRLAGAEQELRVSQRPLNPPYERMCATEHAPRGRFYLLERIYGLAEIVGRGAGVVVERQRVIPPQSKEPHDRAEADALLLESSALAEQKHGRDSEIFLMLRWTYAESLFRFNSDASVENLVEAEGVLEEIAEKWQRPMDYGKSRTHPQTAEVLKDLATVQDMIARARAADATD